MTDKPTELHYEPLTPTGFFMGRIDVSKLPIDKACAWVEMHRNNEGNHIDNYNPTQREDIPLGDEKGGDKRMHLAFDGIIDTIDKMIAEMTKGQVEPEGFWCQYQEKGQCTAYHSHRRPFGHQSLKDLSFVFYLQASEEHGELMFPMQIDGMDYSKTFVPNTGGIIIFPSYMPHYTHKNNADTPRIVLSGNYREKDYMDFIRRENENRNLQQD